MIYVPTHLDLDASWQLSADLWAQVSGITDGTTKYLVAPREHPETGDVYFAIEQAQAESLGLDIAGHLTEWPVVDDPAQ